MSIIHLTWKSLILFGLKLGRVFYLLPIKEWWINLSPTYLSMMKGFGRVLYLLPDVDFYGFILMRPHAGWLH